jgi:isopenicillin N synthase-like dioxygenase
MSMRAADINSSIPLLDLRRLDADEAQRAAFLAELRAAAHDVGFFYVTGHGVEARLLYDVMQSARRFFSLPVGDKLAIEMVNSPHFRGYNRVASERTRGRPDWREQIDIGAERPPLPRDGNSPAWARLQGPNQWPAALPELRAVIEHWQTAAIQVLFRILRAFALALGQRADALDPLYGDNPHYLVKLIRYPGAAAMGDTGGGDALGSTVHRVVMPPAGNERLSAAFFLGARLDATVPVLTLPPALASHARGPERDAQNPLYREVGLNYLKGRLRSHPDVARRHHADLLEPGALQDALRI